MHYRRPERYSKNVLGFEFGYEHFNTSITVLESTGLLWSYIVRNCPLLYTWIMNLVLAHAVRNALLLESLQCQVSVAACQIQFIAD